MLASAAAMSSLTLMRRILQRRSFVFRVDRRSSPVGRGNQPPSCGVAIAIVGVALPVTPDVFAVSWATLACASVRRKNTLSVAVSTLPPLVWTLLAPTFVSASSAASTAAADAL